MATQIFDQQSCIRIMYGERSIYVQKKNVITVDTLQGDTVRIDIGEGALRHIYIRLQDVNDVASQQLYLAADPALHGQQAVDGNPANDKGSKDAPAVDTIQIPVIGDEHSALPIVSRYPPAVPMFRNVDELCDYIKAMLDTWPVAQTNNGNTGYATAANQEVTIAQLSGLTQTLSEIRSLLSASAMQHEPSRIDESQPYIVYNGFALPGTEPADARWAIQKLIRNKDNDTIATEWADGNDLPDNVWNNRFGLRYQPLS